MYGKRDAASQAVWERIVNGPRAATGFAMALLLLAVGCGSDTPTEPEPVVVPPTRLLTAGVPEQDTIPGADEVYYAAPVTPGARYVACVTVPSDTLEVSCFGGDSTFTWGLVYQSATSGLPRSYTFEAGADRAFLRIRAFAQPPGGTTYTVLLMEAPSTGSLVSERDRIVPRGVPTYGQVGTRSSSSYVAVGLTPGAEVVISMVGTTGDADLCPGTIRETGSAQECRGTASSDSLAFGVECGPLNRDGAAYILLVE